MYVMVAWLFDLLVSLDFNDLHPGQRALVALLISHTFCMFDKD
jgi:hypothetical protein